MIPTYNPPKKDTWQYAMILCGIGTLLGATGFLFKLCTVNTLCEFPDEVFGTAVSISWFFNTASALLLLVATRRAGL